MPELRQRHADLIIAGGGLSGLCAAIRAKELGVENVIVLEKNKRPGGNAVFPDLMVAWDGAVPRMPCIDDNRITDGDPRIDPDPQVRRDATFRMTMDWNHWRGDARLIRTLIDESEALYPWIGGMMEPEDYFTDEPLKYRGNMHGRQLKLLLRRCEALRVEIRCATRAKKLLQDEAGRAAGVLAEDAAGEIVFSAGQVILGTGGFMGDEALMRRYLPTFDDTTMEDLWFMGATYSGDGIKMAFEIGAADDGTVAFECDPNKTPWTGNVHTPCRDLLNNTSHPEYVWVSKLGERFCDESKINATNSIYRLPRKACWILFDQAYLDELLAGTPFRPWAYGKGVSDFETLWQRQFEKGYTQKADSWEALAVFIGCPPETLHRTMDEYNADCAAGRDRWFAKPQSALRPMTQPPFYASFSPMPMLVTRGPLRVDCSMRLLGKDYRPIPGFYAVGVDIGGTDSDTYASCAASHSSLFAAASGRIAAQAAARELLNN